MLTFRQMDSIVHNTLLILKGFSYERRVEGTNIFYDVLNGTETGEGFLGTYRVWEWHDGSGRSNWMPFETNNPEITRIRHAVWEAIISTAVPANLSPERYTMELLCPEEEGENVLVITEKPSREFQEKARRAKPVLDMLLSMWKSENPVQRAIFQFFANKSVGWFIHQGGAFLEAEITESAKRLPI